MSLGSTGVDNGLLTSAVESVEPDIIIPHHAYPELLSAVIKSDNRVFAGIAYSYNSYDVEYAGSVAELKGLGDLIRAIHLLKGQGLHFNASSAGLGDIDGVRSRPTRSVVVIAPTSTASLAI